MTIQSYLQSIREKLHVSPKESQKILREIQTHLMQEAKRLEKKGMPASDAEEQACSDFGDPAVIAKGFRKAYSWFFRTSLRVVLLTLIIMLIVQEIPSAIYRFSSSYSVFQWHTTIVLVLYALFALTVFSIVKGLTFSTKRLRQFLKITLASVYFGGILYAFASITFGMSLEAAIDPKILLSLFLGQFIKIIPMILVYILLEWIRARQFSRVSEK